MPIKASAQLVRVESLNVNVQQDDGTLKTETLTIKHRPVTEEWLDKWTDLLAQEERELRQELEAIAKQAAEASERKEEFDYESAAEKIKARRQKSSLVRQLADILISIDHTDDAGADIPPTEEFLITRDKALLVELKALIEKKLFPDRTK